MSEPAYVVMPIRGDGSPHENADEVAAAIEKSLHNLHPEGNQEQPEGPLKKAVANSDSLYKYISWENPVRTLGSYFGLLGLLYGLHYLHWSQLLLKISATGLGAVSLASLVSRSTKSDFMTRVRPEYKEVPESTLNATLNDVHDFVQWFVVQAQKIVYGEDLGKTLGAFLGSTALYWLIQVVSPFNLAILGLTSLYIVPILASPRGREVAQDAKVRAQELAHATAENAKVIAQDGKAKAADLSYKAQQTAGDLASRTQHTANDLTSMAQQHASNLTSKTQQTAGNLSAKAQETAGKAYDTAGNLSHQTRQTAGDMSSKAYDTAGDLSHQTRQTAGNLSSKAYDTAGNLSHQTRQTAGDLSSQKRQTAESPSYQTRSQAAEKPSYQTRSQIIEDPSYQTLRTAGDASYQTRQSAEHPSYQTLQTAGDRDLPSVAQHTAAY